jgi:hypothetical protein
LDGKTNFFFQIGKILLRGRCLAIKEQTPSTKTMWNIKADGEGEEVRTGKIGEL